MDFGFGHVPAYSNWKLGICDLRNPGRDSSTSTVGSIDWLAGLASGSRFTKSSTAEGACE